MIESFDIALAQKPKGLPFSKPQRHNLRRFATAARVGQARRQCEADIDPPRKGVTNVQFLENVYCEGRSYIQDEVYDLSAEKVPALGNFVERVSGGMEATDPDKQPDSDAEARKERDVKHEADDVQKKPDAGKRRRSQGQS